ncbi:MAG: UDP-glucose 4-epimerase GalE [Clostridiales bacterium]|nr:UDP-glucose 4-epimerase GalE [Clostridiales bacterium]
MKVLITGGSGFIGSMICYALSDVGIEMAVLDSEVFEEEKDIKGCKFYLGDIANKKLLTKIFDENPDIEITIHCAEKSSVALSIEHPYEYYSLNVVKSMELFNNLSELGCKKLIFASTAGMYDDLPGYMATELSPIKPRSPFTRSKYITEMILRDFCNAYDFKCISLRYFNPIGADPKGRTGPKGRYSANLLTTLFRIMQGQETSFTISGNDWLTRDSTCIRDYIHIYDVAQANLKAIENFDYAFTQKNSHTDLNFIALNIGSGVDVTVREFIYAFENVTGEKIHINYGPRRPGDIGGSYANINLAKRAIHWEPKLSVEEAILDYINWEEKKEKLK